MRTITQAQKQALEDLSAEGLLKKLPVQAAEKDIHVTELLKALGDVRIEHDLFGDLARGEKSRHDAGIKLVFAGGTCLSKAHGLINRMSEDIDIKVVLIPPDKPFRGKRGDRARLKVLHARLRQILEELGFPLLKYEDGTHNPFAQDNHRYWVAGAGYQSSYGQLASLRPELKLEVINRTPLLPVERREFGYLYEKLAGIRYSSPLTIECISVSETAAEKVLSLLRRCAWSWDGHQRGEMDPALVRHVYDVARIAELAGESLARAREIFPNLVLGDRDEFRGQHPGYDEDPVGVLRRALTAAKGHSELKARYEERLLPLVYDQATPTFAEAFARFEAVAEDFLAACKDLK
jgi:hypothetical protein